MKRLLFLLLPLLCLGAAEPASRFTYVDVIIDPQGQPLAAYQFEFTAELGQISLVGVEASDHPAYLKHPAYYDPAALSGSRIILADYSLDPHLPKGKFRAVRLMLEIRGDVKPQYVTKIIAAANADGKTIPVELSLVEK
jgi:hypothetical protein